MLQNKTKPLWQRIFIDAPNNFIKIIAQFFMHRTASDILTIIFYTFIMVTTSLFTGGFIIPIIGFTALIANVVIDYYTKVKIFNKVINLDKTNNYLNKIKLARNKITIKIKAKSNLEKKIRNILQKQSNILLDKKTVSQINQSTDLQRITTAVTQNIFSATKSILPMMLAVLSHNIIWIVYTAVISITGYLSIVKKSFDDTKIIDNIEGKNITLINEMYSGEKRSKYLIADDAHNLEAMANILENEITTEANLVELFINEKKRLSEENPGIYGTQMMKKSSRWQNIKKIFILINKVVNPYAKKIVITDIAECVEKRDLIHVKISSHQKRPMKDTHKSIVSSRLVTSALKKKSTGQNIMR